MNLGENYVYTIQQSFFKDLCYFFIVMNKLNNLQKSFQNIYEDLQRFIILNTLTTNVPIHHIETSQSICRANQLTGFYMIGRLVVKG